MALDVELSEITDFLAQHPPFDDLSHPDLEALAPRFAIEYVRRGTPVIALRQRSDHLYVVRSGAVDITDEHGALVDRGAAGSCFGSTSMTSGQPSTLTVTAIEDSLVLLLGADAFGAVSRAHPGFARFFDEQRRDRLAAAVTAQQQVPTGASGLRGRVSDLIGRDPVTVATGVSILDAARQMAASGVSCLLVMHGDHLVGIVTDRDLRNRVVAAERSPHDPVDAVMTRDPVCASAESRTVDVLLDMVTRNIHHLPVLDAGRVVGVVTATDLLRVERADPVHLVGDVARQPDLAGVARVAGRLPSVVEGLVRQGASADEISRVVTAVGDAVERRLLALAEAELGPPPVPYCWVVLGSRARSEQALAADQDNAILLHDDVTEQDATWFEALARAVTDGLDVCGYPRCRGDVMATNPSWRQPLAAWRRSFATWLTEPTSDAVMRASIFFDMRAVHGDPNLVDSLMSYVNGLAPTSTSFLAHLAKHAVEHEPPLGFFRGFVLDRKGAHKNTLDIKRGGVGALVELARVHALSVGSGAVTTRARIDAVVSAGLLSREAGADLLDAFEFISSVRLRHQAAQVASGLDPDNHVAPDELSTFEKRHLREAFAVIRSGQSVLASRYPLQYIS